MSGTFCELGALVVYLVILLWIGLRSGRQVQTSIDYTLAGRNVPWLIVLATTAATMVGGGASVGSVAKVYQLGLAAAFITAAWHLQLIFTGVFLAPRLRGLNLITVGNFFERRFGELARRLSVLNCLVFMGGALVAQMAAIGAITESVLDIEYQTAVLVGGAVVVFYATVGGIRAVVKTDVLQFVILVGGIATASAWLLYRGGGFEQIQQQLSQLPSSLTQDQPVFALSGPTWSTTRVVTLFCSFFLGEMLVPAYAVRCFIAKGRRAARWGVAGAGLFLLIFHPIAIFTMGVAARSDEQISGQLQQRYDEKLAEQRQERAAELDDLVRRGVRADVDRVEKEIRDQAAAAASQVTFPMLMRSAFPPVFSGVMIAAILAAVMSSADSCLSCVGTIVMEDIYRPHVNPAASDRTLLAVARWTTLLGGVAAAVAALVWRDIVDILEFVYDFWAPTMVWPFLVGIFWYRRERIAAVVFSMLAGTGATIVWRFVLESPGDVSPALFGFAVAVVAWIVALPLCRQSPTNRWLQPVDGPVGEGEEG
ncbi:MAG: hypothetical protein CMJ81_03305 [Planctomycetaceae bacterium]|nr:hypothetical protein [Planctomycetaceae bacterium]MBP60662.1 hypothetical protein [Planctomycetaceae bacterium]